MFGNSASFPTLFRVVLLTWLLSGGAPVFTFFLGRQVALVTELDSTSILEGVLQVSQVWRQDRLSENQNDIKCLDDHGSKVMSSALRAPT